MKDIQHLREVLAAHDAGGKSYSEFLRRPALSMGVYSLAAGEEDKQQPHGEDEVYYVLQGRAMLRVRGDDAPVSPGSVAYVRAGDEHRFHGIREDLILLVFFAPAETAADA